MVKKLVDKTLKNLGYQLNKTSTVDSNLMDIYKDKEFMELYSFCSSYTMTSIERMYSLFNSVKYIIDKNIEGDFVECGVWKGGSSMLIGKYLSLRNIKNKKIYLYDTFEGMVEPTEKDVSLQGVLAIDEFQKLTTGDDTSTWCNSPLEVVKENMMKTGLEESNIILVKGKVEKTIPKTIPENKIALLRLDTDWYTSTKHELVHLYPNLVVNGVLIIDDFGHWEGAKKAVVEYFKETKQHILLNRIDYTGRIGIKQNIV